MRLLPKLSGEIPFCQLTPSGHPRTIAGSDHASAGGGVTAGSKAHENQTCSFPGGGGKGGLSVQMTTTLCCESTQTSGIIALVGGARGGGTKLMFVHVKVTGLHTL